MRSVLSKLNLRGAESCGRGWWLSIGAGRTLASVVSGLLCRIQVSQRSASDSPGASTPAIGPK